MPNFHVWCQKVVNFHLNFYWNFHCQWMFQWKFQWAENFTTSWHHTWKFDSKMIYQKVDTGISKISIFQRAIYIAYRYRIDISIYSIYRSITTLCPSAPLHHTHPARVRWAFCWAALHVDFLRTQGPEASYVVEWWATRRRCIISNCTSSDRGQTDGIRRANPVDGVTLRSRRRSRRLNSLLALLRHGRRRNIAIRHIHCYSSRHGQERV